MKKSLLLFASLLFSFSSFTKVFLPQYINIGHELDEFCKIYKKMTTWTLIEDIESTNSQTLEDLQKQLSIRSKNLKAGVLNRCHGNLKDGAGIDKDKNLCWKDDKKKTENK